MLDQPALLDGGGDEAANSGCGSNGRDFSSGWNWTPTNQGWSASSKISGSTPSGDRPEKMQARLLERVAIGDVDLVAVAVALGDRRRRRRSRRPWLPAQHRLIGAEPHGAAEIAAVARRLLLVAAHPLGHQADDGLRASGRTRSRTRPRCRPGSAPPRSSPSACRSRCRNRELPCSRAKLAGADHALRAALAEAAGHQDAVDAVERTAVRSSSFSKTSPSIQSRLT